MTWLQLTKAQAAGAGLVSRGYLKELSSQDRLWLLPMALAGAAVGAGSVVFMLLGSYRSLMTAGLATGYPEFLFFNALLVSGLFIFILSIPSALAKVYHSRDADLLFSLPLPPGRIVLSKTALLYGAFLPLHLLFFLPAVYVYLEAVTPEPSFILPVILQSLIAPLAPLVLGMTGASFLSGGSGLSRHRVLVEVSGMAMLTAALVAFQSILSRRMMAGMQGLALDPESLFIRLTTASLKALPPLAWGARSLTGNLASLALSAVFTTALTVVGIRFQSGRISTVLIRHREAAFKTKRRSGGRKAFKPRSPLKTLFFREWSVLSSTSTFLFEAAGEALILPLMLVIFSVMIPREILTLVKDSLDGLGFKGLIIFDLLLAFLSINTISSTSLSREGPSFALSLTLPLSGRQQLRAKLLFHLAVFLPSLVTDIVILTVLLNLPISTLIYLFPGGFAALILNFALTISVDLKNPMLTWTNPQQAMKQNLNTLTGLGLSVATLILTAGIGLGFYFSGFSETISGLITALILFPAAFLFLKRAQRLADRTYSGVIELP